MIPNEEITSATYVAVELKRYEQLLTEAHRYQTIKAAAFQGAEWHPWKDGEIQLDMETAETILKVFEQEQLETLREKLERERKERLAKAEQEAQK